MAEKKRHYWSGDQRRANRSRHQEELSRPAFPVDKPFSSEEDIERYFSTDKIVCLLCGFEFGSLAKHLVYVHGWTAEEYQDFYQLPRRGLSGTVTRRRHSVALKRRMKKEPELRTMWKVAKAAQASRVKEGKFGSRKLVLYRRGANRKQLARGRETNTRIAKARTHCSKGHRFTGLKNKQGRNRCRVCELARERVRKPPKGIRHVVPVSLEVDNWSELDKPTRKRLARRWVKPGFPWGEKFTKPEEIEEYFSGNTVVCLLCGKEYRSLGQHLTRLHKIKPGEYKERFGLPWSRGLTSAGARRAYGRVVEKRIQEGWSPGLRGDSMKKLWRAKRRPEQPFQRYVRVKNLQQS